MPDNRSESPASMLVTTSDELETLCARLASASWLALDTEFIREKTYYPRLCLIQVATPELCACIDPLAIEHPDALYDLLFDQNILKVMHAARQDLEIFYHLRQSVPAPVFDTQVAAGFLGFGDQIGYSRLVEKLLGVHLDKAHTRTDWSQRPLSEDQLHYAADDVIYLAKMFPDIVQRLDEQGRRDWVDDEAARLMDPAVFEIDPDTCWQKVSGHRRLKPRQLAILRNLARWREERAMAQDIPRKWILGDAELITIAQMAPRSPARLEQSRGLKPAFIKRHGQQVVELVADALAQAQAQWPDARKTVILSPLQEVQADIMMALIKYRAQENGLNSAAIGTRKDVEALIIGDPKCSLTSGWRRRLAGDELRDFLAGRLRIQNADTHLVIEKVSNQAP